MAHPNKENESPKAGVFFTFFASLSTGIVTGVAIALIFPGWGLAMAIVIGVSGAFTEAAVFWGAVKDRLLSFVNRTWFQDLEQRIKDNWVLDAVIKRKVEEKRRALTPLERYKLAKRVRHALAKRVDSSGPEEYKAEKDTIKNLSRQLSDHLTPQPAGKQDGKLIKLFNAFRHNKWLTPPSAHQENGELRKLFIEVRIKRVLLFFAICVSSANGIGFGAITYTSTLTALAALGLASGGAFPIALFLGGCAAVAWGLVMYDLLFHAIADNVLSKFADFFSRLLPWRVVCSKPKTKTKWDLAKCCAKYCAEVVVKTIVLILVPVIIATCVLATLGTGGAWLQACTACFQQVLQFGQIAAVYLSEALIFAFVIPVFLLFSIKNILTLIEFLFDLAAHGVGWWVENLPKVQPKWVTGIAITLSVLLFVFHAIGAGAVAGRGVNDPQDKFSFIFLSVSRGLNWMMGIKIQDAIIAFVTAMTVEFAEFPYAVGAEPLREGCCHNHGLVFELLNQIRGGTKSPSSEGCGHGHEPRSTGAGQKRTP